MVTDDVVRDRSRRLAGALEPVIGQVYFSPECHAEYEALGFVGQSGRARRGGHARPVAYFTSRGSALGQAPGELVAAAFAVFNPAVVVPCVDRGWTRDRRRRPSPTARLRGASGQLSRILGDEPEGIDRATELLLQAGEPLRVEGRPLYAGVLNQGLPGDAVGDSSALGDRSASTGATATPRPGSRPASTPPRSAC